PTAFSPNGDQLNDQYQILHYSGKYEALEFSIYNRWGDEVFKSESLDEGWDGTMNNEPLPVGVYVYSVSYSCDGEFINGVGEISLIR
ncbi:MAG: T9SS type B sorting domain-containing protein, partial [Chitinophagales bacterium]|nr:T9SS type B sorting domain-containing protein [Chitinophagales bacterium]